MKNHLVEISGEVSIATSQYGSSDPEVVLIHGLASNRHMYDLVAEELEEMGIASISIDQRGHGDSSKPDSGYDHQTISNDVAAVLGMYDTSRPKLLVGQSWGGAMVGDFATKYPELVSGLILIDGGVFDLKDRFASWEEVSELLAPPRFTGVSFTDLEGRIASGGWSERQLSCIMDNFDNIGGRAHPHLAFDNHMQILRALYDYTPSKVLPPLEVPKLALLADRSSSPLANFENYEGLIEEISSKYEIEVREIKGARHDLHLQFPIETAAAIREMLIKTKVKGK